jgi:hypothetical protein
MCRNVERMLDIFVNMNLEMQKTGNLSASISKEELLKLVTHCGAAFFDTQPIQKDWHRALRLSGVLTQRWRAGWDVCCDMQVAQNNLILTDIITKLGLLDYYDVAWKTSQCALHCMSSWQCAEGKILSGHVIH